MAQLSIAAMLKGKRAAIELGDKAERCEYCLKGFDNLQGKSSHQKHCKKALRARTPPAAAASSAAPVERYTQMTHGPS